MPSLRKGNPPLAVRSRRTVPAIQERYTFTLPMATSRRPRKERTALSLPWILNAQWRSVFRPVLGSCHNTDLLTTYPIYESTASIDIDRQHHRRHWSGCARCPNDSDQFLATKSKSYSPTQFCAGGAAFQDSVTEITPLDVTCYDTGTERSKSQRLKVAPPILLITHQLSLS